MGEKLFKLPYWRCVTDLVHDGVWKDGDYNCQEKARVVGKY